MKRITRLERFAPLTLFLCLVGIVALLLLSSYLGPANPEAHPLTHLKITEVMPDNRTAVPDDDGNYYDWVEITNTGHLAINLTDLYLTDDAAQPDRYPLPNGVLKAGESLLLYLSGDKQERRPYYAPFALNNDGETLYLFAKEELLTSLTIPAAEPDYSFGLLNDQPVWFALATPRVANHTVAAATLSALREAAYTGVTINEVCTVSSSESKDAPHDWIELHNTTESVINLSGYRLTEDLNETGMVFGNFPLEPNAYRLIYCDADPVIIPDAVRAPFSLNGNGDTVYLVTPEGIVADSFETGKQRLGITSGRYQNDRTTRLFFSEPTPAAPNAQPVIGYAPAPIIDQVGGYFDAPVSVTLTAPIGTSIYYTLDGSVPTDASTHYVRGTPITISKTTVLRAVTYQQLHLPGDVVTQTYLFGTPHDIPVVSVSADPARLFGANGAWTQFKNETLRPTVHTEYFSADGIKQVDFDSTFRIAGGFTRYNVQKPFSLNLNQAAGDTEIDYPFFEDSDVTVFDHLLLRPSGSDWNQAKLRDEFCAQALKNADGQLIQSAQPVALYINGDYYGLYYLREKRNEDFIASYTDIPAERVQLTQHPNLVVQGEKLDPDLAELIQYAKTHDLTQQEHYDYVLSQIDANSLIQFFVYQTFLGNGDCVNNTACYRDVQGGKWRWIVFDMDWACTLYYENRNFLQQLKDGTPSAKVQNYHYPLFTALLKNEDFCNEFLATYARLMKTTLATDRLTAVLDKLASEIESEIPRQYARFNAPSPATWKRQIAYIRGFIERRHEVMTAQLKGTFALSDKEWDALLDAN